ncbi:MAG: hypothetical protein ACFFA4_00230 [Promethearchaeota archaeon]
MKEKNNSNDYLSLKNIISESLLRDLILFTFLFILIIGQGWQNIFLLLFPLITFIFSLFFRIISTNKMKTEFKNSSIIYNPLGFERKHADRLFYCSLFQLILIFWIGGESLYNSHLVDNYFSYFLGFFIFLYTFSFFWIFIDSWKYTRIEILMDISKGKSTVPFSQDVKKIISYLPLNNIRIINYITFLVFIGLNILNIIILFFINDGNLGIQLFLPGSQLITISYFFFGFLFISPSLTIFFLMRSYKNINRISKEKLDEILEPLPRPFQIKIIENLKSLNKRIKEQLNRE